MSTHSLALYNTEQIQHIEQMIIQQQGIDLYALMCRAGEAVFQALREQWPDVTALTVLVGTGNNGGDGLVVARLAKAQHLTVQVVQVGDVDSQKLNPAAQARKEWLAAGGTINPFNTGIKADGIIVDALLGTGIKEPLAKPFEEAIEWINAAKCPIISIDVPSGLNSNTGYATLAVKANITVVLLALKVGLMTGLACDYRGELVFDELGTTPEQYASVKPIAERMVYEKLIGHLPPRAPSSHKGSHGHVCVIGGGSAEYSGAVLLAGEAALRSGAGLVSIAAAPEAFPLLARGPMELMCHPTENKKSLIPLLERVDLLVLGSGLGQTAWSNQIFQASLDSQKPCVVDADGLNLLAQHPQKRDHWILTPHPKEASRLLNTSVEVVQSDRIAAAKALSQRYGGIIILKGAGTIILSENQELFIEEQGLPILGTAGTGDVLAGLIGGLWAQGLSAVLAAQLGVCVHSNAAQIETTFGDRGMLASDLFLHIRGLLSCTNPL